MRVRLTAGMTLLGFVVPDFVGVESVPPGSTNTAPTLAALPSQTWTVGTAVNVNLASYGADAQGAITFTAAGLPAGVSISATGLLTGTPTAVASSSATITVTDTGGLTAQRSLAYTVQAAAPTNTAPVITQQPSITPSSATVGDSVTINLGAATGAVGGPTWTLMRGATNVTAQVDNFMAIEFTTAGTYTLSVSWTNTTGTTNATPATITVAAAAAPSPGVDLVAVSYMHQNGPRPFTGPANAITGYTAEGTGARAFSIVGTGADVAMDPARGPLFASGKYARNAGNTASIADGVMVLAKYAVDTATAVDTIMALTGGITVNMRWDASGNRVQYNYNVGGGAVNANGVTAAAHRDILAFEIDRVAGTLRYWDGEKIVTLTGQTITSPAFTTIDLGSSLTGVISRSNVITRDSGVAWPVRFEDVLNVYGAGITPPFP